VLPTALAAPAASNAAKPDSPPILGASSAAAPGLARKGDWSATSSEVLARSPEAGGGEGGADGSAAASAVCSLGTAMACANPPGERR